MVSTTSEGEDVYQITLENGGITVELLSLGAILKTLKTPDRNGIVKDIVLGFDNPLDYLGSPSFFGQIVGRFANRINQGTFILEGKRYQLEQNEGKNSLHSGSSNWGWRNWHVETFEWNGNPGVVFSLFSKDGDGGFPNSVTCTVSYVLKGNGELCIEYEATTTGPTPINLTNHSYFNLGGAASGSILKHEVELACDRYLEMNAENIPTGNVLPVANTKFDFTKQKAIGRDLESDLPGYDHCFILAHPSDKPTDFAWVYEPTSGRTMKVSTTLPAFHMYTGTYLPTDKPGKGSFVYPKFGGVCFETEYYPDGPNHDNFPSCIFSKERTYKHTTVFTFGSK